MMGREEAGKETVKLEQVEEFSCDHFKSIVNIAGGLLAVCVECKQIAVLQFRLEKQRG